MKLLALLGSGLQQAKFSQETRLGAPGEPNGIRTALRWTVYGKHQGDQKICFPSLYYGECLHDHKRKPRNLRTTVAYYTGLHLKFFSLRLKGFWLFLYRFLT